LTLCKLCKLHEIWPVFFLRKIIQIVATRCHILRLKCTKFNLSWGFVPYAAGRAYSPPPDRLAGIKEPYFRGEEGIDRRGKEEKDMKGSIGGRGEGEGKGKRVRSPMIY